MEVIKFSDIGLKTDMDILEFFDKVFSYRSGMDGKCYGELTNFVQNLLIMPHSSAATERKFSQINLIKTIYRNKLEHQTINNIMQSKQLCKNQSDPLNLWHILNKIAQFFDLLCVYL